MTPATQRARKRRKKKRLIPAWLHTLWPLIAGILVTPFALRAASILAMSGPSALRLLYPFVALAQGHAQHLAPIQEETLAQWVMYGQFPFYGLVWIVVRRMSSGTMGALSVVVLHCGGVAAAILRGPG